MFDKTNSSKDVMKSISESINNSVPKIEIFQQMKSKYPQCDQDAIAKDIASFISEDVKRNNVIHSYILSFFVVISIIFVFITPSLYTLQVAKIFDWSWRIIIGILAIYFIIGFIQFKLFYYTTAVSLYSLYLLLIIYNLLVYPITSILIISSVGTIITFIYLYLLRNRIFPNIDLWGKVKKENGIYKF
jgi:hypothetical protein